MEEAMKELSSQGYHVARTVLSSNEMTSLRDAISETIDRVARAFRAPFEASCPESLLEQRIDNIARLDRSLAVALFHAVMADAQRDPRIDALSCHSKLTSTIADVVRPLIRTGQVIRTRAAIPALSSLRSPWHQDVIEKTSKPVGCATVRLACWIPLTDVDERSGALELIPGAWTDPLPHCTDHEGRFVVDDENLPASSSRVVSLNRGDVLFLDRFVPHRSLPVQHGRARWAVVMWVKAEPLYDTGC
jgi:ectoine hydroxylase-related dioxygenase (phytanoyl-CoA dioxygenase family)